MDNKILGKYDKFIIERENSKRKFLISMNYKIVFSFGERFKIFENNESYYFYDKYWPDADILMKNNLNYSKKNLINQKMFLFIKGFLPKTLEIKSMQIKSSPEYLKDNLFWQYPCITEKDFYFRHIITPNDNINGNIVDLYVPIPWATFIDKKSFNKAYLMAVASRIKDAKSVLENNHIALNVHTCCQHIEWKSLEAYLKVLSITDLWISHKKIGENELSGIKLHSWGLYAVNYEDKNRSSGMVRRHIPEKKYFASFVGAHMPHYLSNVRQIISRNFKSKNGYKIIIKDNWHYHGEVYEEQSKGVFIPVKNESLNQSYIYNEILSDSIFSLCPEGAGVNTIRLWESLAVGAVPVLISDELDVPYPELFAQAVIRINAADLDNMHEILNNFSISSIKEKQRKCIEYYSRYSKINILSNMT